MIEVVRFADKRRFFEACDTLDSVGVDYATRGMVILAYTESGLDKISSTLSLTK